MTTGETLAGGMPELSDEQLKFADFIVRRFDISEEQAATPISHMGMTASLRQGIAMCMDHIFAAEMSDDAMAAYVSALLATAEVQS